MNTVGCLNAGRDVTACTTYGRRPATLEMA